MMQTPHYVDDHGDSMRVVALTEKAEEVEIVLVHSEKKEVPVIPARLQPDL